MRVLLCPCVFELATLPKMAIIFESPFSPAPFTLSRQRQRKQQASGASRAVVGVLRVEQTFERSKRAGPRGARADPESRGCASSPSPPRLPSLSLASSLLSVSRLVSFVFLPNVFLLLSRNQHRPKMFTLPLASGLHPAMTRTGVRTLGGEPPEVKRSQPGARRLSARSPRWPRWRGSTPTGSTCSTS